MHTAYGYTGIEYNGRAITTGINRESGGRMEITKLLDEVPEGHGNYNVTLENSEGNVLSFALDDEGLIDLEKLLATAYDLIEQDYDELAEEDE